MLNKKVLLLVVLLLLISTSAFALPTQAEIERYCVQVRLIIDQDVHNFAVFSIVSFDEKGLTVRYGKRGEKRAFYPAEDIMNFDEAMEKYRRIK